MYPVRIDESDFQDGHQRQPGQNALGLWTFKFEDRAICFWGRYPDVTDTAQRYAQEHGITNEPIRLLDCTQSWPTAARQ